jgi:hydroxylamine reductase (hybrid-cluster protein)
MPEKVLCICMLCRVKNPSGLYVAPSTRTRHRKQERKLSQWSNTQSTAVSVGNQDIFGTATENDDVERESISAISMITSSEQYLVADQELFDSDDSEFEEEDEEDEEDEADEEEEDMIEAEDLGKHFYDLTQMCTPNGYIFYIRIGNLRRSD